MFYRKWLNSAFITICHIFSQVIAVCSKLVLEETILSERDIPGASLPKDLANGSVLDLKHWLECHGEKKFGRKQELVDRV